MGVDPQLVPVVLAGSILWLCLLCAAAVILGGKTDNPWLYWPGAIVLGAFALLALGVTFVSLWGLIHLHFWGVV